MWPKVRTKFYVVNAHRHTHTCAHKCPRIILNLITYNTFGYFSVLTYFIYLKSYFELLMKNTELTVWAPSPAMATWVKVELSLMVFIFKLGKKVD